jgi:uncharacterized protein YgbK (DUF1537 family)
MIFDKNGKLYGALGLVTAIAGAWIASDVIIERLPVASKKAFLQLVGSVELLTKQQMQYEYRAVNRDIADTETQLFDVGERLKQDVSNPDARARRNQLKTKLDELFDEKRRAKCQLIKFENPNAPC